MLGICRGMQVLNVALGGSLSQHIEGHRVSEDGRPAVHPVDFTSTSRLARLLRIAGRVELNSLHHQALKALPAELAVVARSHDDIVEAVESTAHRWAFGVQCHPERAAEVPPAFQKLFAGLVEAATTGSTKALSAASPSNGMLHNSMQAQGSPTFDGQNHDTASF